MSNLSLKYNPFNETIEMFFKNKELQSFLSSLPQNTRTWNKEEVCWVVVPEIVYKVISYSRHFFNDIDCSSLPIRYQREVQEALSGILKDGSIPPGANYKSPPQDISPYRILYLTSDAPDFIVKSVFKTLVKKYHPDVGGNTDKFREVKKAHDRIKELRGW